MMYEELIKRLRALCEDCKLWDGYKCCLKGDCTAQTRLQAADAIEELSRLHEAQRQNLITLMNEDPEMEWIPVTERLPEDDVFVLNCNDHGNIVIGKIIGGTWWYIYFSYQGQVTHWMPLPDPPKEET